MTATLPPLGKTPYLAFMETDKKMPVTRTIEDAIDRYRTRHLHDPDHVLLNPAQAKAIAGATYTHSRDGLTVEVFGCPIVPVHEVYVGHSAANEQEN